MLDCVKCRLRCLKPTFVEWMISHDSRFLHPILLKKTAGTSSCNCKGRCLPLQARDAVITHGNVMCSIYARSAHRKAKPSSRTKCASCSAPWNTPFQKRKTTPSDGFLFLTRSTEKDITCQVDISNRYTCNNLYFADCIHRNDPQHFLLFHISYMHRCYQTNCTYLLLN